MAGENKIAASSTNTSEPQAIQVKVNMLQGEYTGQPKFSNLTSVQEVQGITFVDFGFLDPQAIISLN